MESRRVYELSDCTTFRQTLLAQPPRVVHGTLLLLTAMIGAAVLWGALTEADLVVRARGRVRPALHGGQLAVSPAEESQVSPLEGGRVAEVHAREGDQVRKGDILIRLEAEHLQNELGKQRRTIQAGEEELVEYDQLKSLMMQRFETTRAKAEAELSAAEREIGRARDGQSAEIRLAEVNLKLAEDVFQRQQRLADRKVAAEAEFIEAKARFEESQLKLDRARLPIDEGRVAVLRQALELVEREHVVELAQLNAKRRLKEAELQTARLELANLELRHSRTELRSPSDGILIALNVKVGDIAKAGEAAAAVAEQDGFRIDVAVASNDVGHLRVGMPARVKLDAYDFQKYGAAQGKVVFVAPDSEVAAASGQQQVPTYVVKIALESAEVGHGERLGRIKLGMTGLSEIVTGRENLLSLLVRSIKQSISLG